ncbi:MAG: branched-chain amino acid ABC transporter permease [Thermoleophilia bacterium]|nr:branched-chain amino acid ABC transporter permease [Thermoleophilia bacterium]
MRSDMVQVLYTAVVLGSTYALMASGLTLIWGGLRFLNLAYGAVFSVGAFAAYWAVSTWGLPAVAALPVGFATSAVLGAIVHVGVFRPLLKRPDGQTSTLVAGLGVALFLQAALVIQFSPRDRSLPALVEGSVHLPGGVVASASAALVVGAAVITLTILGTFLTRSRYGVGIRALANHRDGAELLGINTGRLVLLVMVLGSGLAGLAGVLLSSFYFVSIGAGFTALVKGLIVTITGGLGNLRGTLIAAYLVGLVESSVSLWLGARWSLPLLFAAVLILLVARPQGIAGRISFEGR